MVSDPLDAARDLQQLTADLQQLEAEYNMFFAGRRQRPPWETRARVEAVFKRWGRRRLDRSADQFRFDALQSRFAALAALWERGLRAREEGRPGPFAAAPPKSVPVKDEKGKLAVRRVRGGDD
jgi:hypothetical protein